MSLRDSLASKLFCWVGGGLFTQRHLLSSPHLATESSSLGTWGYTALPAVLMVPVFVLHGMPFHLPNSYSSLQTYLKHPSPVSPLWSQAELALLPLWGRGPVYLQPSPLFYKALCMGGSHVPLGTVDGMGG